MTNKKIAQTAMLSALAIIFGYIENLLPLPIPVYGAKTGISNSVILAALYSLNPLSAWSIMLIKTICSNLLFGGFSAFLYSFSGGILSVLAMYCAKKTNKFGIVGVSILGGISHNIGQLICAGIMLSSFNTFYYLPVLIICGTISGLVIGIITNLILKHTQKL